MHKFHYKNFFASLRKKLRIEVIIFWGGRDLILVHIKNNLINVILYRLWARGYLQKRLALSCRILDNRDVILTVSYLTIASSCVTALLPYRSQKNSK